MIGLLLIDLLGILHLINVNALVGRHIEAHGLIHRQIVTAGSVGLLNYIVRTPT